MLTDYIRITASLVLKSDLHIAAANSGLYTENGEDRKYTPVIRGINGLPVIPATSLKGVLRSLMPEKTSKTVFGSISDHSNQSDKGSIGRLWLNQCFMPAANNHELDRLSLTAPNQGCYQKTNVALHPDRASANDNQLFHREFVASGAKFTFSALWFGDLEDSMFIQVIAQLSQGIFLGSNTAKGSGNIALDMADLSIIQCRISNDGTRVETVLGEKEISGFIKNVQKISLPDTAKYKSYKLTLSCDGPFISMLGQIEEDGTKIVAPLEQDGKPVLWVDSLKGALRARAGWLAELGRANSKSDRDDKLPMDDPRLEKVLDGRNKLTTKEDLQKLSTVEHLFGVCGLRASLTIHDLICTKPGSTQKLTSVSIDRITGGGRDKFLFTERVFWGPEFTVVLSVPNNLPDEQHKSVAELLKDIMANGLTLGHGASKGFGWFNVRCEELE